jgi:hypothetical protein
MNIGKNMSLIASAVAAALGAGAAMATVPTTTPNAIVYAGGGASDANTVLAAACRLLTNVDSITDNGTKNSSTYRILYGDLINTVGSLAAGSHVLVVYDFFDGAYPDGVLPQTVAGSTLPYPQTSNFLSASTTLISGATQGSVCTTATAGKPTYSYTLGALSNNEQPDWGVADLEASIYQGINNPTTKPTVSVGAAVPVYDAIEGVAVTAALYSKKTNFSSAEVAGILNGFYTDWSQLYADNGSPLPAGGIILIDRDVGSAIKAAGNQYFLGFPGLGAFALSPGSVLYGYTGSLVLSQTLQDVLDTTSAAEITDLQNANASGLLALGILAESSPPALNQKTAGTNSYDFVKINNNAVDTGGSSDNINGTVASSYINAIYGDYDFFFQANFNYRPSFYNGGSNNAAFAKAIAGVLQSSTIAGVASGTAFPLAAPGILIDADTQSVVAKGVTLDSRGGQSESVLFPVLNAGSGAIPVGSDPL